jgi:hypothetical protein
MALGGPTPVAGPGPVGLAAAVPRPLGFADLAGYLRVRWVEQGWSVRRMRAELKVGRAWLAAELHRLGFQQ